MTEGLLASAGAFRPGAPAPVARFAGLPRYDFVYGHNDPDQVPARDLAEAAHAVLSDSGRLLGMYNLGQAPQGHDALRAFVADKLARRSGIRCGPDDVLITSGSLQAMDLVNALLVGPGDTVILAEFTYGGAITKVQRLGATAVGAPLDEGGLVIAKLRTILEDLRARGVRPRYIYTIPTVQNPTGSIMDEGRRLWLKLPEGVDVRSFAQPALDQGLAFNPGPDWACDPEAARNYMRLCFALPSPANIRAGVAELARICFEHTGIPARSANLARR